MSETEETSTKIQSGTRTDNIEKQDRAVRDGTGGDVGKFGDDGFTDRDYDVYGRYDEDSGQEWDTH